MNKKSTALLLSGALFALIFLLFFYFGASRFSFIQDDTFISLRYAHNFAAGNGLVFNPGERTEGYTSLLWVLILSAAIKLNIEPAAFAQGLSLLSGAASILLTFLFTRLLQKKIFPEEINKHKPAFLSILVFSLFAFNPAYIYWSVSGMDEMFFICLLVINSYLFYKNIGRPVNGIPFVVSAILLCLTRPEGILFTAVMAAVKVIALKKTDKTMANRRLYAELAAVSAALLIFLMFRIIYYGYPLPNTFYAKAGFSLFHITRGFDYFLSFLKGNMLYGIIYALPLAVSLIYKNRTILILSSGSLLYALIVSFIGGDVLPLHRLYFPSLPFIYTAFILSFSLIAVKLEKGAVITTAAFLFTASVCFFSYTNDINTALEKREYEMGLVKKMSIYAEHVREMQSQLNKKLNAALSTIGAFAYYSDAYVIDMAGLTDSYIAHNHEPVKGITDSLPVLWKERTYNAGYVLSRKPDYIIFPAGGKPSAFPECAVFVNPRFINNYYTQLIFSDELNEYLPFYALRNDDEKRNYAGNWDNTFAANYINAVNLFTKSADAGNKVLINGIKLETGIMVKKCKPMESNARLINGMALFHAGEYKQAKTNLTEAVKCDPMNSPAYLYLRNLELIKKDTAAALTYMIRLKRISPAALPNFRLSF